MKLTKFGILVNKTTSLFTSIRDSNISRGCAKILEIPEGRWGTFWGRFWKIQRGGGVIRQIPSVGGGGGGRYGYFLEPHNVSFTSRENKIIKHGMVKNPFWQELITSWPNAQPWPLSSTHDSQETTSGQSSALSDQELTWQD